MKLISMTDFILDEGYKTHKWFNPDCEIKYANFLKQPLTLGMFVPCDDEGYTVHHPNPEYSSSYHYDLLKFDLLKDKVLFERFSYEDGFLYINTKRLIHISNLKEMTIEFLIQFDLTLTPSALKQIGL